MPLTQPEAFRMVQRILGTAFDLRCFRTCIANLLSGGEMLTEGVQSGACIPENFREDIASYQRIAKFQTAGGQTQNLEPALAQRNALTAAMQSILDAKDADPDADVAVQEAKIDSMVFDLYGLTERERTVILTA